MDKSCVACVATCPTGFTSVSSPVRAARCVCVCVQLLCSLMFYALETAHWLRHFIVVFPVAKKKALGSFHLSPYIYLIGISIFFAMY